MFFFRCSCFLVCRFRYRFNLLKLQHHIGSEVCMDILESCNARLYRSAQEMMSGDDVSMQNMSCFPGFPLNKKWPKKHPKSRSMISRILSWFGSHSLNQSEERWKGWTDFINFSGQAEKNPRQSPKASDFCCVFKVFPGWWNNEIWEIHPNFMKFPRKWEILSIGKSHPQTLETEEELTGLFVHTPESQVPITLKRLAGNTCKYTGKTARKLQEIHLQNAQHCVFFHFFHCFEFTDKNGTLQMTFLSLKQIHSPMFAT